MSLPYTGGIATATTILIACDVAYVFARRRLPAGNFGRRERIIEASVVAALVSAWIWLAYPVVFTPGWHGAAGYALYGLIAVPLVAILFYVGYSSLPPIGVSGIVFVGFGIIFIIANMILPTTPGQGEFSNLLNWPIIISSGLAVFIGVYLMAIYGDSDTEEKSEHKPIGFAGGDYTTTHNSGATNRASVDEIPHEREVESEHSSFTESPPLEEFRYDWRYSETSFDDIGGYYELKTALDGDVLKPLRAAQTGDDRYSRFDIEPERGILLYGPPGTGKTMFARALAGELDIPFVELSPADVTSMWVNESSDQIKTLFDEADEIGQCIVFLDEAEHLFGARDHTGKSAHAEDRKVTSEFLAQLTRDDREAIVVSATNRPGDIDRAILRPGRLTAHFEVGLPDDEARHAILEAHLNGIPSTVSGQELATLADRTEGLTGADLANLVEQARRSAAHRNAEAVTRDDFPPEEVLDELSAELASENETGELPESDDSSDAETAELPEAKAGVRADDGESDSEDDGPTRGYQ